MGYENAVKGSAAAHHFPPFAPSWNIWVEHLKEVVRKMFCCNCGRQVSDGVNYCSNCGKGEHFE